MTKIRFQYIFQLLIVCLSLHAHAMQNQEKIDVNLAIKKGSTSLIKKCLQDISRDHAFLCWCINASIYYGNTATLYALIKDNNFWEKDINAFMLQAIENKDLESLEILEERYCTCTPLKTKFLEVFKTINDKVDQQALYLEQLKSYATSLASIALTRVSTNSASINTGSRATKKRTAKPLITNKVQKPKNPIEPSLVQCKRFVNNTEFIYDTKRRSSKKSLRRLARHGN